MVYLQNKNPNLGKIWRVLEWKLLLYFMTNWSIFRSFDIIYGLYIFPDLVCLNQEKSGNPVSVSKKFVSVTLKDYLNIVLKILVPNLM
jgi:hypothetical protein